MAITPLVELMTPVYSHVTVYHGWVSLFADISGVSRTMWEGRNNIEKYLEWLIFHMRFLETTVMTTLRSGYSKLIAGITLPTYKCKCKRRTRKMLRNQITTWLPMMSNVFDTPECTFVLHMFSRLDVLLCWWHHFNMMKCWLCTALMCLVYSTERKLAK